jgi:ribosomal protein S18 acetylase RimI-like enzyme
MKYTIQLLKKSQFDEIAALDKIIFPLEEVWPTEAFEYYFGENNSFVAVDEQGAVCGYIFVKQFADGFHIANFGVAPGMQNQGIGNRLMDMALTTLANQTQTEVRLQVRKTNTGAFRLYQKFGFTIDSSDDDWFKMKRVISSVCTNPLTIAKMAKPLETKKNGFDSHLILGLLTGGFTIVGLGLLIVSIAIASIPLGVVSVSCLIAAGLFGYSYAFEKAQTPVSQPQNTQVAFG